VNLLKAECNRIKSQLLQTLQQLQPAGAAVTCAMLPVAYIAKLKIIKLYRQVKY
jgi:hypothetical protein